MNSQLVLGALYGDEGKGTVVQYLAQQALDEELDPIINYWSNGNQNGHTIVHEGIKHVCQTYGSGILLGVPTRRLYRTYLEPISAANEIVALKNKGVNITNMLYLAKHVHLITPYDRIYLIRNNDYSTHRTTGLGVYTTICRVRNSPLINDLSTMTIETFIEEPEKILFYLTKIRNYYDLEKDTNAEYDFLYATKYLLEHVLTNDFVSDCPLQIFEGTQGMGLSPVINSDYCTATGVGYYSFCNEMCRKHDLNIVVRTYATRHGSGPVSNIESSYDFSNIDETNQENKFQGEFKTRVLDFDELMDIARINLLLSNAYLSYRSKTSLFITHMDVPLNNGYFEYVVNKQFHKIENPTPESIIEIYKTYYGNFIGISDYYYSVTPDSKFIKVN